MKDVTSHFQSYREGVRHLWNTHFRSLAEGDRDRDLRDAFDDICAELFGALVLYPLGLARPDSRGASNRALNLARTASPIPLNDFQVVPASPHGVPIFINRTAPSCARTPSTRMAPGPASTSTCQLERPRIVLFTAGPFREAPWPTRPRASARAINRGSPPLGERGLWQLLDLLFHTERRLSEKLRHLGAIGLTERHRWRVRGPWGQRRASGGAGGRPLR